MSEEMKHEDWEFITATESPEEFAKKLALRTLRKEIIDFDPAKYDFLYAIVDGWRYYADADGNVVFPADKAGMDVELVYTAKDSE